MSISELDSDHPGLLYAFGSNGSGQLGLGHDADVSKPTKVIREDALSTQGVHRIACGGNHTVILLNDGRIASTGENGDGRCRARIGKSTNCLAVSDSASYSDHRAGRLVAATWSATFVTTSNGTVSVSGSGKSGELGLGESRVSAPTPELIENFPPHGTTIVRLSACMAHVAAVLSNGEVWGWGKGRKGQLGSPHGNVWTPRKVAEIDFFAIDAVCGKDFTCVIGRPSTGEVAVLGPNSNDRFGIRADVRPAIPGWKQVAASWGNIFVLLQTGEVIAWGRDDHGQLPPAGLPPLEALAAGSEHCLGLTKAGKVLAWGWGEHGNCGKPTGSTGDVKGRYNEIEISRPAVAIFAGCATSFVVVRPAEDAD